MGNLSLEHEKGCPSPQAKSRKASLKGDETGRIGVSASEISFNPQLYSVVKEQNDKLLFKKPVFQDELFKNFIILFFTRLVY